MTANNRTRNEYLRSGEKREETGYYRWVTGAWIPRSAVPTKALCDARTYWLTTYLAIANRRHQQNIIPVFLCRRRGITSQLLDNCIWSVLWLQSLLLFPRALNPNPIQNRYRDRVYRIGMDWIQLQHTPQYNTCPIIISWYLCFRTAQSVKHHCRVSMSSSIIKGDWRLLIRSQEILGKKSLRSSLVQPSWGSILLLWYDGT